MPPSSPVKDLVAPPLPRRPPGAVRHCGHRLLGNRADDVVDSRPLFRRADQRVDAHILWARQREVEASDMRA